jgi:hypothetical protein
MMRLNMTFGLRLSFIEMSPHEHTCTKCNTCLKVIISFFFIFDKTGVTKKYKERTPLLHLVL